MTADTHVFQITQALALMCERLPLPPSGFDLVAFLEKWQDLTGAIIGGLLGVIGALIVARSATRRERKIAATMVLPEVQSFEAAQMGIAKHLKVSYQSKAAQKRQTCFMLLKQRPKIRALHGETITHLYDLDARLFAHLSLCKMIHEEFEASLGHFEQAWKSAKAPIASPQDAAMVEAAIDIRVAAVTVAWDHCVEHATLANYFLGHFNFSLWPVWAGKLRMRLFPNDFDRRSKRLLKEGQLPVDDPKQTRPDQPI
ncbi:hypothetical protein ACFQ3P_38565 [Paraburkholderia sabiae]|uniref:Uncharacterized protein n=1 Tax=Paraburkholderia sabiae TaxID=273251 RepID=A0ABU9QPR3_9BURK|nr:hypothetical protein [Paraburkholderia sabiae]WJZ74385.1 hypothetical protein QEN71_00790 [Paraburkholderia sabiae]CAD6562653.1 hypothetical protein LMG24235_07892 [Paraburkholderia sabiae]